MAPSDDVAAPLAGLTLIVTRPAAQSARFIALAEAAGAHCIAFPVLEIEPLPLDAGARNSAGSAHWDWLIFTSTNAVEHGLPLVAHAATARVVAVGRATERALQQRGLQVHARPESANSEGILALPEFATPAGQRVLLVKGRGGRDLLRTELERRGAIVEALEVYERKPAVATPEVRRAVHEALGSAPTCVAVTSSEVLEAFVELVGLEVARRALDVPLLLPGERVAATAQRLGWRGPILQASTAEDATMLATLRTHWPGRPRSA